MRRPQYDASYIVPATATARVWAADRKELIVYVGPIILNTKRTIGDDQVIVPSAFWKVVVDPANDDARVHHATACHFQGKARAMAGLGQPGRANGWSYFTIACKYEPHGRTATLAGQTGRVDQEAQGAVLGPKK